MFQWLKNILSMPLGGSSSDDHDTTDRFGCGSYSSNDDDCFGQINPANGLPMVGAVDVCGNPYGSDFDSHDSYDSWSSSSTSYDIGTSWGGSSGCGYEF